MSSVLPLIGKFPRVHVPPTMIIAAHPDDETIGLGSVLSRCESIILVYTTDGAPENPIFYRQAGYYSRSDYRNARKEELLKALQKAGIGEERCRFSDIPDQKASFELTVLTQTILRSILDTKPFWIATHSYEGGHPDHDATAYAVHTALALLERSGVPIPELIEFSGYHARGSEMATMEFLSRPVPEVIRELSREERGEKMEMFGCFLSQSDMLSRFPCDFERFRNAPDYDFLSPPHAGQLWYERFDWGMTGSRWRTLAYQSLLGLGLIAVGVD